MLASLIKIPHNYQHHRPSTEKEVREVLIRYEPVTYGVTLVESTEEAHTHLRVTFSNGAQICFIADRPGRNEHELRIVLDRPQSDGAFTEMVPEGKTAYYWLDLATDPARTRPADRIPAGPVRGQTLRLWVTDGGTGSSLITFNDWTVASIEPVQLAR
jgi:hypothetical protein